MHLVAHQAVIGGGMISECGRPAPRRQHRAGVGVVFGVAGEGPAEFLPRDRRRADTAKSRKYTHNITSFLARDRPRAPIAIADADMPPPGPIPGRQYSENE